MRVIIECKGQRREFPLPQGSTVIGRDPASDICYPEGSLSRRHLECIVTGDDLIVRDLETKNGTYLGPQRIREAHITPGIRLRAGNVWFRFEADQTATQEHPGGTVTRPLHADEHPELACSIPDAEHLHDDEEATPLDENAMRPAAEESAGTRLVTRDGRWFMVDASGKEVEIVPVQRSAASGAGDVEPPTAAAVPAGRPAVPTATTAAIPVRTTDARHKGRKRFWILVGGVGVFFLVLIGVLLAQRFKAKPSERLSVEQYRAQMADAVREFEGGKIEEATARLQRIAQMPKERRAQLPHILLKAFDADVKAQRSFVDAWEAARKTWREDVLKSSETQAIEPVVKLAKARVAWLETESLNMAHLNEARLRVAQGDYLQALKYATAVAPDSIFRREADPIIPQSVERLTRSSSAEADQRKWEEAEQVLRDVIKLQPELESVLQSKIAMYRQFVQQRAVIDQARQAAEQNKHAEVLQLLEGFDKDSPYARDAAALVATARSKGAVQLALNAYNGKDGEKALEFLKDAGPAGAELAARVRAVLRLREEATQAAREEQYDLAVQKFREILHLEARNEQRNLYAQEAKAMIERMPDLIRGRARDLVEQAEAAAAGRDFAVARAKYEEAMRLDGTNRQAIDGLSRLIKNAIVDYNRAMSMAREDPAGALRLMLEVRERLPATHELHKSVAEECVKLEARAQAAPRP